MNLRFWRTHLPDTASDWFARLRPGNVSKRTDTRFREWLVRDADNERAYERQELAWEVSYELEDDPEIQKLLREAETATTSDAVTAPRTVYFRLGWVATVAAVVLVSALTTWWSMRTDGGELYVTAVGEQRTVILSDQSQLTLNTATRVYVNYTRKLRSVRLEQGEATFKVAHDAAHPFEVSAAGAMARALGTEFNVLEGKQGVTVSVLEGRVEVLPTGAQAGKVTRAVISGGEEVTYSAGQLSPVATGGLQRISAWHNRRVSFQDVTLEEAIEEFNRYTQTRLVFGDPSLRQYRVSGVFRVGETQALLSALREAFGVTAEQRGNSIILWPKRMASMTVFNEPRR